jgi:hypothetical protein
LTGEDNSKKRRAQELLRDVCIRFPRRLSRNNLDADTQTDNSKKRPAGKPIRLACFGG